MKTLAQLEKSIERFEAAFWRKERGIRPPVGVTSRATWLPVRYLRREFRRSEVLPEDVRPEAVATDYEFAFANRAVSSDDWMPFAAPWRAIPWLEAACGCGVRFSTGALAPEPCVGSPDALKDASIPARPAWLERLRSETERLVAAAPADCWISPTILRGPSDVLAAMRGLTNFLVDLYDNPEAIDAAAERVNRLFMDTLDVHFEVVGPKLGGYGHIFGYWAPGRTIAIQEDVMGMCAPSLYRDIFMKHNCEIVRHLGAHVLFHLHSTGFQHYRDVLTIPGLAGLQMTIESNGPELSALVPVFQEILERSRLALFVDSRFDQLHDILPKLPSEGLYLVIPDDRIRTEKEYEDFVTEHWKHD